MRAVRNITVAVEPELYHQTRKTAAEYNTSVTDMVRFLLPILPEAVKAARYPGGRPQFGLAAAPAQPTPSTEKSEISPCTPVNPAQPPSLSATCEARLPSRTV
jgi:hypothetical protein